MAQDNLYKAVLALACGVVLATAIFVALKCYSQYDTVFKAPERAMWRSSSLRMR
jgi:hypothetical protein